VLLQDLTAFRVSYLQGETWQEKWQDSVMPKALKITLVHDYLGEIERVFALPTGLVVQGTVAAPNPNAAGQNSGDTNRNSPANPNNPGQPGEPRRGQR
jgi:general secretion pathway protein J